MQAGKFYNLTLTAWAVLALSLPASMNPAWAQTEMQAELRGLQPLQSAELEALVGPIALYPDDLLSIVLDASAHPLQLVAAARFLDDVRENPELKPDADWDESVVALLNYPEVLDFLNEDLEWTESLGFAFLDQQEELFAAVQKFRKRAYAAGNLKSDDYQQVVIEDFVIKILPAEPDTIYIPAYEPAKVVVYQPYPVFGYYPYAYPVYYYPYAPHYSFGAGFFWGVTTYFTINWISGGYHTHYYGYHGHPYYRHTYHYRNHYYYGGTHYTKHGRHHVKHARRHARRHSEYSRYHYSDSYSKYDGRDYIRDTKHKRYRDGNKDQPRTIDGSRREQFARSDQRTADKRRPSRRYADANRTSRQDYRQTAARDTSRPTNKRWKSRTSQRDDRRWQRRDGDQGVNNRRVAANHSAPDAHRDVRRTVSQASRDTLQRTAPGAGKQRATQRRSAGKSAGNPPQQQIRMADNRRPQARSNVQQNHSQLGQRTRASRPQTRTTAYKARQQRPQQSRSVQSAQRQLQKQSRSGRPQARGNSRSSMQRGARAGSRNNGFGRSALSSRGAR